MRGLLFARVNFSKPENGGINLKCKGELKVLRDNFDEVDFLHFMSDGLYLNEKRVASISEVKMQSRSSLAKLFMLDLGKTISKAIDLSNYNFLYFRYCLSSKGLLNFLQNFKAKNPESKIVTELPTYPYAQEYLGIARKIELKVDQFYRKNVFSLIDKIAHLGEEKNIYSTATLPLGNGITVEDFPIASSSTNWDKLQIIAVGNFNFWHGLDRLAHGIQQYNGNKEIEVRIIGKGWEDTKQLCIDLAIDPKFTFYHPLNRQGLDEHFAWANLGIGTLAIHRKNVAINQSLKHREYAARGLSFVFAGSDPGFKQNCSGIVNIDESDSPLDINFLLENFKDCTTEIREFAKISLSWNTQFRKVLEYIQEKKN